MIIVTNSIQLIDGIKDKALDFLLEYLPKVKISKINGKKEEYSIDYQVFFFFFFPPTATNQ